MIIRLENRSGNYWSIVVAHSGAVLSTRQWPNKYRAIEWCRAIMSSYRESYTLEVQDVEERYPVGEDY